MRRRAPVLGVAVLGVLLAVGGYLATRTPTETYAPAVAGVVLEAREGASYRLAGRSGWVDVDRFVSGFPAAVGDVLLAGDGSPTWAYPAFAWGVGCWKVTGNAILDGETVDLDASVSRPGVSVHLRLAKSPAFVGPVGDGGKLLGSALCLDSEGRVVSDH